MSSLSSPTRREAFLLVLVFVALLWFSTAGFSAHDLDETHFDNSNTSDPLPLSLAEHWRTRITWSNGIIPNTRVVSHVPGVLTILAPPQTFLTN